MSALGGKARRIPTNRDWRSRPQWSPDGNELACVVRYESGTFAEIVSLQTGERRLVPLPGAEEKRRLDFSWSPDGRLFSYVDARNTGRTATQLWVTHVADGRGVPLTDAFTNDWSPSWSPDGRSIYYVSNRGGTMDLWQQPIGKDGTPEGDPQSITSGLVIRNAALSPDGTKLAYSKGRRIGNIWRVPILSERPATWADAEQITFEQALIELLDISPDGSRILFHSDRGGNADIWMMRLEDGEMSQVTRDPAEDFGPQWSPDGRSVAFYSLRSGNRDVWTKPLDGGPARQVTKHEDQDLIVTWSPDGQKLAFFSGRDDLTQIYVVPVEGGEERRVTDGTEDSSYSDWSPDGSSLVFNRNSVLYVVSVSGGPEVKLTKGLGGNPKWSRDGSRVYFNGGGEREGNIWEVQADGSAERPVTDLAGRPGRLGFAPPANDGKYLYFIWTEDLGNIWVMDVVTDESE